MVENAKKIQIDYKRVGLFLIIAISLSNVFRFDVFDLYAPLEKYSTFIYLISEHILEGSGVFIGAILAIHFLKKKRETEISLFGTSKKNAVVMAIIPVVLLTVIGVDNKYGFDSHLYGFIAGFGSLVYCIMEEYGWRGYLEEEFKGMKILFRVLLIGSIWYFWHLSFLTQATLNQNLFFLGTLIFGSWGIGKIAELTKSILASACFHLIVNLFMFNHFFNDGISGNQKMIVVVSSILIWIAILVKWDTKNIKTSSEN
jgi:uncharacterized protein